MKKHKNDFEKKRIVIIAGIALLVIVSVAFWFVGSVRNNNLIGGILGLIIAAIIVFYAALVVTRGNKDLREGFPLQDERSKKVLEKASSRAFYISLYLLLAVGMFSEKIPFRDISQATGITVGLMALIFAICWAHFNKQEL